MGGCGDEIETGGLETLGLEVLIELLSFCCYCLQFQARVIDIEYFVCFSHGSSRVHLPLKRCSG